ncbi:transcription factor bHLH118-like isoform X1 [Coffea arabica]|uniref:Transcription factor bHLH118-like isoform X1 n=1 Tax=Coffea arabica TaxID=13443 RepID=A0A6P6VYC1_COFAR|nr:transcription factor bHLH118-like isoform X1 [Coffea arabica]
MDDFTYNLIPLLQDDPMLFEYLPISTVHPDLEPAIPHQDLQNQVVASSLASRQEKTEEIIIRNNINTARKRQTKASSAIRADNHDRGKNPDESKQKKANHRDIERRRRQEMAKLYASLRNLLPLECKKTKRSISDHLLDAVNHIKHMKKNIRELEVKRDKQINLTAGSSNLDVKIVEETNSSAIKFTLRQCSGGGIEILMKNYLADTKWFPLSKILDVLLDEGLAVVSCVCTKVNEEFLYTIQTEVNAGVDLICLQEKLTKNAMTGKDLKVLEQYRN